ncbi:hypothetical protein ACFV3R_18080 [Streptomyces sp. NPDC059740]
MTEVDASRTPGSPLAGTAPAGHCAGRPGGAVHGEAYLPSHPQATEELT